MARHKTRDYAMLLIINGATKAGVHRDQRKHASLTACRGKEKMIPARKPLPHDVQIEWTRDGEHGEAEVFDIYGARLAGGGWHITRADIVDENGYPVPFNTMSFSDDEMAAISLILDREWEELNSLFP